MRSAIVVLFLSMGLLFGAESGSELKAKGVDALRLAQADPDQLVVAAKLLCQAADALTAEGKESEAEEVNACLYWAKKKMTIQQMDAFLAKGNGVAKAAVAKMDAVEKMEVKPDEANAWLGRADAYALKATDQFLVAVRYFEVASRFKGTPEGEQALEKSLKALQLAKVAQDPSKVVGAAQKGDGKVYVQSLPVGASILVRQDGELRDTGAKTPSLVQLPKGPNTLVLRKEKYEDAEVKVVAGDAISKPDVVKLEPPKFDVEVTVSAEMGEGWSVFVDGRPVLDKAGKPAVAPCTVSVVDGNHRIGLAKEGFKDFSQTLLVKPNSNTIKMEGNATKGLSALLSATYMDITADLIGGKRTPDGIVLASSGKGSKTIAQTKKTYNTPIQIDYVCMTDSTNIRLSYGCTQMVFNWEENQNELRLRGGPADGQHRPNAGQVPTNKMIKISQIVMRDMMTVYVDGQLKGTWKADFSSISSPIGVFSAEGSTVTIKSVKVKQL